MEDKTTIPEDLEALREIHDKELTGGDALYWNMDGRTETEPAQELVPSIEQQLQTILEKVEELGAKMEQAFGGHCLIKGEWHYINHDRQPRKKTLLGGR